MAALPFTYPVADVEASAGPTPWQTVGPFFHDALPYAAGPSVVGPARAGALVLHGQVLDGEGAPIPDALVEVWQADEQGAFHEQPGIFDEPSDDGFRGFGRCPTDADGHYAFRTTLPGAVPGGEEAAYVAMSVFARGMLRRLVTRVYFEDAAGDPLLSSLDDARRRTLIAVADEEGYRFDVRVQGADETVFLDVRAG